jgi:hypothetical protein
MKQLSSGYGSIVKSESWWDRVVKCGAIAGMAIVLAGCSKLYDQYVVNSAVVPNSEHPVSGGSPPDPINLDCYVFLELRSFPNRTNLTEEEIKQARKEAALRNPRECPVEYGTVNEKNLAYYMVLNNMGNDPHGIYFRNRLIDKIVTRSNEICHIHKAHILANAAVFGFATGLTSSVLSTVATVVGGSAIISAAAASTNALGANINAHFYQNLVAVGIVKKIDALRAEKLNQIREYWKSPSADYTIDRAIRDIQLYHRECSFFRGVTELANDTHPVPQTRAEIDEEIKALKAENVELAKKFMAVDGKPLTTPVALASRQEFDANKVRLFLLRQQRNAAPLRVRTVSTVWNTDAATLGSLDKVLLLIDAIHMETKATIGKIDFLEKKQKDLKKNKKDLSDGEKKELTAKKAHRAMLAALLKNAKGRLDALEKSQKITTAGIAKKPPAKAKQPDAEAAARESAKKAAEKAVKGKN